MTDQSSPFTVIPVASVRDAFSVIGGVMSGVSKALAEREAQLERFSDQSFTVLSARTTTGTTYRAMLGDLVDPVDHSDEGVDGTYTVRKAYAVSISVDGSENRYPQVVSIGYDVLTGTLLALDLTDTMVRRSSTLKELVMS